MPDDHARVARLRAAPRTDRLRGERMHGFCEALQTRFCAAIEKLNGQAHFSRDVWERPDGGGGVERVIAGGDVFTGGFVGVSAIHGLLPEPELRSDAAPQLFAATGLSLVLHAGNPYVPSVYGSFRHVRLGADPFAPTDEWFGGRAELVPIYPSREDAESFHRVWKTVCDRHPDVADYPRFKRLCDARAARPHGDETRGVGGILFDALRDDPEGAFHFVRECGRAFLSAYVPLVERHRATPFGERERAFQQHRQARIAALEREHAGLFETEMSGPAERALTNPPTA